jgi:hypothetical protein
LLLGRVEVLIARDVVGPDHNTAKAVLPSTSSTGSHGKSVGVSKSPAAIHGNRRSQLLYHPERPDPCCQDVPVPSCCFYQGSHYVHGDVFKGHPNDQWGDQQGFGSVLLGQ